MDYVIEEGLKRIDWPRVHSWLTASYWSPGITPDRVLRAAQHSAMVLSTFREDQQVGYLRVVSDKTRFAYLCDVWIDVDHRGKGLARALVSYALEHPDFATTPWLLATADAHGLYLTLGFAPLETPHRFMICPPKISLI